MRSADTNKKGNRLKDYFAHRTWCSRRRAKRSSPLIRKHLGSSYAELSDPGIRRRRQDRQRPAPWTAKLRKDDALPRAETDGSVSHLEAKGLAHQHAARVRIRVLALAVGIIGIVVTVVLVPHHHLLEESLRVVQQRFVPFVY